MRSESKTKGNLFIIMEVLVCLARLYRLTNAEFSHNDVGYAGDESYLSPDINI